jgi:hypothetical protein
MINADQARAMYTGPIDDDMISVEAKIKNAAPHAQGITYWIEGSLHTVEEFKDRLRTRGFTVETDPKRRYSVLHFGQHVLVTW